MSKYYIGLMSGTSLDGIDAAVVEFEPTFKLIASHCEPIPSELKQKLQMLTLPGDNEIDQLGQADIALGKLCSQTVNNLLTASKIRRDQVHAIGSHGQTIRHRPEFGYTLQIGDPNIISEQTGITTVADFRRRDMAAGGQGAPLVPAFHQAMLSNPQQDRILVNIGGMANITFLPANPADSVAGFDTGPGNILMDAWINHHKSCTYDHNGEWACSGLVNQELLSDLLSLSYFSEPPPKSTGREQFNLDWLLSITNKYLSTPPQDIQRTLLELTANSIADGIKQYVTSHTFELLVCGGGSRNPALVERIQALIPNNEVRISDDAGIDADWMEAAAFAWLAMQCLEGSYGNKPSVTGAKGDRILGAIYQA